MNEQICTPKCWTPVICPDHGHAFPPWGRSMPPGMYECCDRSSDSRLNTRHLWDEHDSDRAWVDRAGWDAHYESCENCNPKEAP